MFNPDQLTYMIQLLREAKLRARRDTTGRIALELALIKMGRLSELESLQDALDQLAGLSPGARGAPAARPGNPGQGASPPSGTAPPSPTAGTAISRMKERLRNGRRPAGGAPAPASASPAQAAGAAEGPDGGAALRDLKSRAEDAEVAREAMAHEPLRKAFEEGDNVLGLRPVRLERTGAAAGEAEAEETPDEDSEQ
jgi:hypothetical protein